MLFPPDQGRAPGRASNGGRPFQWFRIWYGWFFFLFEPASEDDGDEASSYEEDRPIEEEQEPLPEGQELTADLQQPEIEIMIDLGTFAAFSGGWAWSNRER